MHTNGRADRGVERQRGLAIKLPAVAMAMVVCGLTNQAVAANCESLTTFALPDTTITAAQSVPAGTFTLPSGQQLAGLPEACRVTGTIKPSSDSNITFEVWLPLAGWNSKLQQVGNGGLAGNLAIFYATVPGALQRGYAVAGTDDGHQASGLDGSWALGHPEKVKDFGYRAVHLTNANAKAIIAAFYARQPRYSYFNACSEGGREAHMEVQRFPTDFDGVLVGSPAHFWTDLMVRFQWDQHALLNPPGGYIPASKLPAIQAAALAACDANDGIVDGIVNDPRSCSWNPSSMLCTGADNASCLNAAQADALNKIYEGPTNPRTGERISTGYERSGENSGNWVSYIIGPAPGAALQQLFSVGFYQGFVFEDPTWDFRTFDFDRDVALTRTKLAAVLDATNPDIGAFQRRGGKIIQYHGWIDASPHPRGSIEYYEDVVREQTPGREKGAGARDDFGKRIAGLRRTQDFYRLFMVPGMEHCLGGPGPNVFGQILAAPPPSSDAAHDALTALEQWVEHGIAPKKIIATKYVNDNPASGIQMQRPLCPYPKAARWRGTGSTNDASKFVCADEDEDVDDDR
jgi:Tannase and feruloyl esterase